MARPRLRRQRRTTALGPTLRPEAAIDPKTGYPKDDAIERSVRIMPAAGFKGTFALEYEEGPLNGVEGAKYLYKEVLAALTAPTPVI